MRSSNPAGWDTSNLRYNGVSQVFPPLLLLEDEAGRHHCRLTICRLVEQIQPKNNQACLEAGGHADQTERWWGCWRGWRWWERWWANSSSNFVLASWDLWATDGTDAKTGGSLMYKYVIDQKGCKAEIPERASCRSSQVDSLHHRSPLGLARPWQPAINQNWKTQPPPWQPTPNLKWLSTTETVDCIQAWTQSSNHSQVEKLRRSPGDNPHEAGRGGVDNFHGRSLPPS